MIALSAARHRPLDSARPGWRSALRVAALGLAASLVVVPAMLITAPASAATIDGNETINADQTARLGVGDASFFQSFTPKYSGVLESFTFLMRSPGAAIITAELQAVDGSGQPTGPVLGVYSGAAPEQSGNVRTTVSGDVAVVAGVQYAMTFSPARFVYEYWADSNSYQQGTAGIRGWVDQWDEYDLIFSTRITAIAEPGAPAVTSAVSTGSTTAAVTITPPSQLGELDITSYTVTAAPGGEVCTIDPTTVPLACTVSNLIPGSAYTYTAAANTIAGPAVSSAPSLDVVQPAKAPTAPTSVAAARTAKTVATVSVTPPAQSDMPVTSYRVTSADTAHTCDITDPAAVPLSCDVTGLTLGETYSFTATAMSAAGTGVASAASNSVSLDPAVPDAPAAPTAQMDGKTAAVVTFAAPDSDRAITGYTVTSTPDGKTCATSTALTCTVTGLTMGTDYTFTVSATSKIGTSAASAASAPVSYQPVAPGAPASVVAVSSAKTVATVTVTAPQTSSDLPITKYTVTSTSTPDSCEITDLTGSTLSCAVTGLTIGTTYAFTATATSAAGTSAASKASNPVRRAPVMPDAPAAPTAQMDGKTSAVVTFAAPDSDLPITGYTVTSTPGGNTCTTTALTCTVTGLPIGTDHTFTVTATSSVGQSTSSPASNTVVYLPVAPDAPAAVTAVSSAKTVATVTVTPPADASDRPITGYTVSSTTTAHSCTITDVTATPLTCDVTGLTIGTTYAFTATATSTVGTSLPSGVSNDVVRVPVAPDLPASVTATITGATTADVVITPPTAPSDRPITSYTVTASPGGLTCTTTDVTAAVIGCTITGLTRGESYTFTAAATSAAGTSTVGAGTLPPVSTPVIPSTLPLTPENVVLLPGNGELALGWAAPLDDGGRPLGDYQVSYRAVGDTTWSRAVPVTGLSTRLLGLNNGTAYEVSVAASTAAGTGPERVLAGTPFDFVPVLVGGDGTALAGTTVHRGDTLTISGEKLPAGAALTAELHSAPVNLGAATVGSDGRFRLNVTIPADAPAGAHTIVLRLSGAGGPVVESRTPVTVVVAEAAVKPAAAATPVATAALASSGFEAGALPWAAGALLLLGAVLARYGRRRLTA